jgi:hypothetical protein
MHCKLIVVVALAAALVIPIAARAHEGHPHTVMGTVSSIDGKNLMVKTADGKTIMVMMDAKTSVTQGKTKLEPSAIKVGDRVVAAGAEDKAMIMAETVKVGAAPAAAKPAAKK